MSDYLLLNRRRGAEVEYNVSNESWLAYRQWRDWKPIWGNAFGPLAFAEGVAIYAGPGVTIEGSKSVVQVVKGQVQFLSSEFPRGLGIASPSTPLLSPIPLCKMFVGVAINAETAPTVKFVAAVMMCSRRHFTTREGAIMGPTTTRSLYSGLA